ncbi:uncharacterized protein LOC112512373 isoform X1 [Cynara cardunculus var. scolymus]|uniref:uncharacterized protein LOC112512373 isoform X1 n=1 Tax=Cynara cardunculus var. scolymus TaxID=59895 RepID=UPI000D624105|nr:uncharacterized protein LOC112512373 isoform X1 [Cynara cardunculus var. scolymus]XP_024974068.1 uncharacterized protein LOC112512373 isoform X1 [Cynara cardunculus var. scolymus]
MSDEGEKTCPLCAEEMDLTDQQLKPCKCGYEICVWCWHHIMDMAEKDNTEGRCPACRTPYNKEKIVGTASKCERLVTGMSVEKKQKSQKGKIKSSEGRKQLGSVRVIQRNLVYIVGLPLNLADEDLLQQKEYFGQYGKVLKVSISRTAAGAIQQFANSTCSVYITYSKEEEAVRSIQSAHGFVLEGRPLRACFGTTKYCHAWLRNAPCTNADCLYLHEFGPQEDSFTKDEIISAYTRNRVQQITGATTDMQRRSGNLLPPPADDHSNNSTSPWAKPISKSTTNQNPANGMKVSPPNSSSGRSVALPAAASWGTRASNSQPIVANVANFKGQSKQQADPCSTTLSFSSAVVSPLSHGDEIIKKHSEEIHTFQEVNPGSMKKVVGTDHRRTLSETVVTSQLPSSSTSSSQLYTTSPKEKNISGNVVPDFSSSSEISRHYSNPVLDKDLNLADEGRIHNLSSIDKNQRLQLCESEQFAESLVPNEAEIPAKLTMDDSIRKEQSDLVSNLQKKIAQVAISEAEEDLLSFNDQRLRDTEVVTQTGYIQNLPHFSSQHTHFSSNGSLDPPVDQNLEKAPQHAFNGYSSTLVGNSSVDISNGHSSFHGTEGGRRQMGMFEEATPAKGAHSSALDLGESSIISNILSMEFDPWDESLTSPQNLAKFLGGSDKQPESHRVLSSRKTQNSNQSRFAFARQDECTDQGSSYAPNLSDFGRGLEHKNFGPGFGGNNSSYYDDKRSNGNGFSSFSYEDSDNFATNYSPMSENKISGSRSQVSAPPGFSGPNRAPPPGFTSHERMEQTFDNLSGNHMFNTSPILRKAHQASAPVNIGGVSDFEFMDPAILAVGGRVPSGLTSPSFDMKSNFHPQPNSFENDVRLQLLMQRSFSQQSPRFTELGDGYPQHTDSYGIPSRIVEQPLSNNLSPYQQTDFHQPRSSLMSNGHWNGWNEVQGGNDIAIAELLRNERLGFNRYYSGHEDTKFQLPTSGDLYNRTYGI